jgi:hypothetical protein
MLNLSSNGNVLYFNIQMVVKQAESNVITDQLKIWSYEDEYPQSAQEGIKRELLENTQTFAYNISSSRLTPITDDNLKLLEVGKYSSKYLLLVSKIDKREAFFRGKNIELFLMDIEFGEKKLIAVNPYDGRQVEITGDDKYVIWYDQKVHRYFSFDIQKGMNRDLSSSIAYAMDTFKDPKWMRPSHPPYQYSMIRIGVNQKERLIVSDQFDLWELDPSGKNKPICITGGTGRKQGIQFRVVTSSKKSGLSSFFVEGFDIKNKNNGVYSLSLNSRSDLQLKEIAPLQPSKFSGYYLPQKAANAEVFLLPQQKANESVNLFVHRGTNSVKVTDFHQEDDFNWFESELHTYKLADGSRSEGILYKPENFDPSKKYPVIFYYYQILSNTLNNFIEPTHSEGTLPIPWFVSNDYLVFVPDVTHQRPSPGDRISDCIVSAAKHVAALPYVDAKHMGLQGHSFGGYETNLLITKSNLFAAAQSSAGLSNYISLYFTILGGMPGFCMVENGQPNMPGTPWEYKEQYINDIRSQRHY